jgi:excisionase family DNA binding protein
VERTRELLRPADLAPRLGLTTGRIYQLIRAGVIPVTKVGGAIRIPRQAWERWLRAQADKALDSIETNRRNEDQPDDSQSGEGSLTGERGFRRS